MQRKFDILDGLRGILAVLVVAYHILQIFYQSIARLPLHHAYLAVDFFFLLSGFVIGYAYDHRWQVMSKKTFLKARFIRLHPLAIAGLAMGLLNFVLYNNGSNLAGISPWIILMMVTLHSFLLPYTGMRDSGDQTHAFNGPSWSLFQEYLVNIVYAFIGHKLSQKMLGVLIAVSAILLSFGAYRTNTLHVGWDWTNFWMGPVRVFFSFFAGLFIFRSGFKLSIPFAFPVLSLVLLILVMLPVYEWNGLYDAFCVVILFPVILAIGAGSQPSGNFASLTRLSGEISYPLYMLHAPILSLFALWVHNGPHSSLVLKIGTIAVLGICILFAWLMLHYFDKPVRAWLSGNAGFRQIRPSMYRQFFARFQAYKAPNAPAPRPN